MSGALMKWAMSLDSPDFSQATRLVFLAFAWHALKDGICEEPPSTLMASARVDSRTFQRAVVTLKEYGILEVEQQGGGRGKWTIYRVVILETTTHRRSLHEETTTETTTETTSETTTHRRSLPDILRHSDVVSDVVYGQETTTSRARASVIPEIKELREKIPREDTDVSSLTRARTRGKYSDNFEAFWHRYPDGARKVNKKGAHEVWVRKNLDAMSAVVMEGLERWIISAEWEKQGGDYIPLVVTWLNQDRYYAKPKAATDAAVDRLTDYVSPQEKRQQKSADALAEVRAAVERMDPNGVSHVRGINESAGTRVRLHPDPTADGGVLEIRAEHTRRRIPRSGEHRD